MDSVDTPPPSSSSSSVVITEKLSMELRAAALGFRPNQCLANYCIGREKASIFVSNDRGCSVVILLLSYNL